MEISPFLTDIGKDYNPKIKYVAFCDLGEYLGEAQRRQSFESYKIFINKDKLICPYQILQTFYHEIGHIVLYHLGYRYYLKNSSDNSVHEAEADNWAFNEMGMLDELGRVKEENELCFKCINTRSKNCLKGGKIGI